MSTLTRWALDNDRLVLLAVVLILVVGPISFLSHPSREDPEITVRTAVVTAVNPGMSPQRIEQLVTRRLEEKARELPEVENVVSTSRAGASTVRVELYDRYDDLQPVWQDLRNVMSDARGELPEGTAGPFVNDDYGAVTMASIALTGTGFTMTEVSNVARDLRRQLYAVTGVSKVELYGIEPERIFVEFDNARLAQLGITAQELMALVQQTNVVAPGGRIQADGTTLAIEPTGNFTDVADIGRVTVSVPGLPGQVVYLRDLAEIRREYADPPENPVLFNGESAVIIGVQMQDRSDSEAFGARLQHAVAALEHGLPIGYRLRFVTFQPDAVTSAIRSVTGNLYQTVAIVLVVVMLFLGWRTGLIVGLAVPLTMLATLLVMRGVGIELERMSLATLIIALGLLVDNGIVMAEEIGRRLAAGEDRRQAALATGRSLALPLLASSLTTILAFMPLMMAENEAGEYTRSLSLVIAIALLASWVLAMTVTPLACLRLMPAWQDGASNADYDGAFYRHYRSWLAWVLDHRLLFLAGVVALLLVSAWGLRYVPKAFFPASDRAQFQVYVDLPAGSNTYATLAATQRLSSWLADAEANPEVTSHAAYVGDGGPRFYLGLNPIDPDPHRAFVIVNARRLADLDRVMPRIREFAAARMPEARVRVKPLSMGATESGLVEYRIVGPDAQQLYDLGTRLQALLRDTDGAMNVQDDWENRIVKVVVEIDQAKARRVGVTTESVASALSGMLSGIDISEYREGDQIIPISFRAEDAERTNLDRLRTLNVARSGSTPVPLFQIAAIRGEAGFAMIQRRNLERVLTVSARHRTLSASAFDGLIRPQLEALALPPQYRIETGGEIEGSSEAQAALFSNMPAAGLLILLILVGQFNSLRRPVIIIAIIPLALTGVTLALLALPGATLSFLAILGILSLAGIIINNAIVLIDRIDTDRRAGSSIRDATLSACVTRLRPIVMTTITTILGLMPLIWSRDVLFYDLAAVVSGGLLVGTVLSLGVVPVLYTLLFRDVADSDAVTATP